MASSVILTLNNLEIEKRLTAEAAQIKAGELIHLLGPNGAGKSSLLSALSGLLPYRGRVVFHQKELSNWPSSTLSTLRAYLPQQGELTSVMPVFSYLAHHLPAGVDNGQATPIIAYLCQQLRLDELLNNSVARLSGGQWQRVRLAAVLLQVWPTLCSAPHSPLLLLDEPYSALDIEQQLVLDDLLNRFCALGGSVVLSSHDINHSLSQAKCVWLLNQGAFVSKGAPLDVLLPELLMDIYGVAFERHQFNDRAWIVPISSKK